MLSQNFMLAEDPLSLERIRSILTRLEDTIIFSLIERAQFAHNPKIYQKGAFEELTKLGVEGSWLEWFLKETETFHGGHLPLTMCEPQFITDLAMQPRRGVLPGRVDFLHSIDEAFMVSQPGRISVHSEPSRTSSPFTPLPQNPLP
jgi:hypothetical protein